ncbi:MAG: hypothetical protein HQ572_00180 [Candidatus Omnitrophica bacterium]|nr:hypothetical protein [Candidatus Omnitrophota bacterium]
MGIKRIFNWQVALGVILIALSVIVYVIHYIIFRDVHHIFIYLIGDIAFVFFEVLLVTLILHKLLSSREKLSMLKKLNMVIGAFFSEVGTELIAKFSVFDVDFSHIAKELSGLGGWTRRDFARFDKDIKRREASIDLSGGGLVVLNDFLVEKRPFLLNLLENPNLLEHESFTNLLWAVFHLTEELSFRQDLIGLTDTDLEHVAGDIKRAYQLLIHEWLSYMLHLQRNYPYLFSLASRTNPFNPNARVEVR